MVKGVGPVRIQIEPLVHRARVQFNGQYGPTCWSAIGHEYTFIFYMREEVFLIHIDMYIIYNCKYMYRISLDLIYYGRRLDLLVSKE